MKRDTRHAPRATPIQNQQSKIQNRHVCPSLQRQIPSLRSELPWLGVEHQHQVVCVRRHAQGDPVAHCAVTVAATGARIREESTALGCFHRDLFIWNEGQEREMEAAFIEQQLGDGFALLGLLMVPRATGHYPGESLIRGNEADEAKWVARQVI